MATGRRRPSRRHVAKRPRPGAVTPGGRGRNLTTNPAAKTESGVLRPHHHSSRNPLRGTDRARPVTRGATSMYSIEARGLVKTYPLPGKAPDKDARLKA